LHHFNFIRPFVTQTSSGKLTAHQQNIWTLSVCIIIKVKVSVNRFRNKTRYRSAEKNKST